MRPRVRPSTSASRSSPARARSGPHPRRPTRRCLECWAEVAREPDCQSCGPVSFVTSGTAFVHNFVTGGCFRLRSGSARLRSGSAPSPLRLCFRLRLRRAPDSSAGRIVDCCAWLAPQQSSATTLYLRLGLAPGDWWMRGLRRWSHRIVDCCAWCAPQPPSATTLYLRLGLALGAWWMRELRRWSHRVVGRCAWCEREPLPATTLRREARAGGAGGRRGPAAWAGGACRLRG